jgi:hypothetical protein
MTTLMETGLLGGGGTLLDVPSALDVACKQQRACFITAVDVHTQVNVGTEALAMLVTVEDSPTFLW